MAHQTIPKYLSMKRSISILIVACCLYGFADVQAPIPPIKLDFFKSIPNEIDGCSGLYTYDTTSLKDQQYIFVTNLQDLAFIRINGKTISLKEMSREQLSPTSWRKVYDSDEYSVILVTKESKRVVDYVYLYTGILEITNDSGYIKIQVHGECGC